MRSTFDPDILFGRSLDRKAGKPMTHFENGRPHPRCKGMGLLGAVVFGAFACTFPVPAAAIPQQQAMLLLTRTGFQPAPQETAAVSTLPSQADAAAYVVSGITTDIAVPAPAWTRQPWLALPDKPAPDQEAAFNTAQDQRGADLKNWWVAQMLATPSPLTERLVLFWHNHFTTQLSKVSDPWLLWRQQAILRGNAGGSFAAMLQQIVHDPAMLIFLDQPYSTAEAPTANFARELLELFTLGEKHYTETDILEVARALTGLTVGGDGLPQFDPAIHDNGAKTILGRTGNFGPDDVVAILLSDPDCATFIVGKLWKEFVSPNPDPVAVAKIAAAFRADGYQLAPVLRSLFTAAAFWEPANRGTLVKSPAEFVIGAVRNLGLQAGDAGNYVDAIARSGQTLFEPPNVRGYLTGTGWINAMTLAGRQAVAQSLALAWQTEVLFTPTESLPPVAPADYAAFAAAQMGDLPLLAQPMKTVTIVDALQQVLFDPAYSLK